MVNVTVSIDLGSSLTKAVWSLYDDRHRPDLQFLTIEPEVMQCSEKHLNTYRSKRINIYATEREDIWVKLDNSETAFAVGYLAQNLLVDINLKALKYESALYKILAVLGIIAQKQKSQIGVNLLVMLPWSEWNDQTKLKEQLHTAVKSFWFRGKRIKLNLKNCRCLPEGSGVTLKRYLGASQATKTVVTLVFGHRNTSCLVFGRGVLIEGDTTNQGFHRLIEKILTLTSGQDRKQLTQIVYQLGDPLDRDNSLVYLLCKSQNPSHQQREAIELVDAIQQAQIYYWELINQWLLTKIPAKVDEIVIAGGAAKYLYARLGHRFLDTPTYWGTDWQELIENHSSFKRLDLHEQDRESLAFRLVDVYACHHFQSSALFSTSGKETAVAKSPILINNE